MSKREEYWMLKNLYESAKRQNRTQAIDMYKEQLQKLKDEMTVEEWLTL